MIAFSCHRTVFALNELSNVYEVESKFSPYCLRFPVSTHTVVILQLYIMLIIDSSADYVVNNSGHNFPESKGKSSNCLFHLTNRPKPKDIQLFLS